MLRKNGQRFDTYEACWHEYSISHRITYFGVHEGEMGFSKHKDEKEKRGCTCTVSSNTHTLPENFSIAFPSVVDRS